MPFVSMFEKLAFVLPATFDSSSIRSAWIPSPPVSASKSYVRPQACTRFPVP